MRKDRYSSSSSSFPFFPLHSTPPHFILCGVGKNSLLRSQDIYILLPFLLSSCLVESAFISSIQLTSLPYSSSPSSQSTRLANQKINQSLHNILHPSAWSTRKTTWNQQRRSRAHPSTPPYHLPDMKRPWQKIYISHRSRPPRHSPTQRQISQRRNQNTRLSGSSSLQSLPSTLPSSSLPWYVTPSPASLGRIKTNHPIGPHNHRDRYPYNHR